MVKFWVALGLVILAGLGLYYFLRNDGAGTEIVTASSGDLVQEVSVTGKVKPAQSVELGFDRSGRISGVFSQVGERVFAGKTLVTLYNADLVAQLREAEANLKAEEAKLEELKRGTRPEDIRVQEAKLAEAEEDLADKLTSGYTAADDAIRNKVDVFFSNPRSANPQLSFSSPQYKIELESERAALERALVSWVAAAARYDFPDELSSATLDAEKNLKVTRDFLDTAALAVNNLTGTSLSQTTIDTYQSNVSAARTGVNTAINNLSGAKADWLIAASELAVKKAGSSAEEILGQEAKVQKAEASVGNIKAQISKTIITSPLSGVLSRMDAKVGEIAAASDVLAAVISDAKFQIEANLPEADISKVKINDTARLTLDAYGSDVRFEARVVALDPAETIVEGVVTYKATFEFLSEDSRIRPGMTANLDILTARRENVLILPSRAVRTKDGAKFVLRQKADGALEELEVKTGLLGSDGRIEIVSGLEAGDKVALGRVAD